LVEDVTDRKQLEESLENERAIRIGSAKMAAIGLLAAEIAHEINNPLQIIQGYASRATSILRLSAPNESEFIEKYSNSVNRAVTQIATIVKGLLTYSRNASLDPMQMSAIADPIDMTVAMVKHLSAKHGIELSISGIDPSSIEIECRTGQIVQVLYNLLLNAIDAVKEAKEKWIKVDLSFLPGDERLQIRVINSGTLIDANILQEITKPFFTTKPAGKGTGLGLYITKGIIESHNGRLWHEDGQANTTFVVELPCRKTDQLIS
jgi:signal transduction histidine kinase